MRFPSRVNLHLSIFSPLEISSHNSLKFSSFKWCTYMMKKWWYSYYIIHIWYFLSRPGLVFPRAATVIKYYYYFYSNFTSDFFLTCSNYTYISLVKHISTSVLLQLENSHIWDSHKRLSVSNISSSNSGRTMRSPPQSYIYI